MADHRGIRGAGGEAEIAVEGGLAFVAAAVPDQLIAVGAPGFGRRVGEGDRRSIGLAGESAVSAGAAEPPDLALIIAEEAVPAVPGQVADDVEACARIVQLDLVVEKHLSMRSD